MNLTNQTLSDIGSGIYSPIRTPERASQGPHRWHEMTGADFASRWDYELENHITLWIVTPISEAAMQWLYCHLPDDCPRYGANGFIIEAEFVNQVIKRMTADKLMSPQEYEQAMEEANQIAHQWDNQDG